MNKEEIPQHIAIIMDGNGRWAKIRNENRIQGHVKAKKSVRKSIEFCVEKKIKYLTLFAFSTENWKRPKLEVQALMNLLNNSIFFFKKLSSNLKRKLTSVFGLFQFSVEKAYNVKNFIFCFIDVLITFSTVLNPCL